MSADLEVRVEQYLEERRRLGFDLRCQAYCLRGLACYVRNIGDYKSLTLEVMVEWARQTNRSRINPRTWARRLKSLRPFTHWLQQFEPRTEVPDYTILGRPSERLAPHIYTEPEIIDLLAAARRLGPEPGLNGRVFEMLFGLIACTGMRVSEVMGLRNSDDDLQRGLLTIRRTKFAKSRHVPIHLSAVSALGQYRWMRDLAGAKQADEAPFFPDTRLRCYGEPLDRHHVERVFDGLRKEMAWVNRGTHHAPRIHDLRHYPVSGNMPSDVRRARAAGAIGSIVPGLHSAYSMVSERIEKGEQLVIGSKAAHPPALRFNFVQRGLLHLQICIEIDLSRLDRLMSEPQGNYAAFNTSLQQFHRCRVSAMSLET